MKTSRLVLASALSLVVVAGGLFAAEKLKSGPQVGEKVPGPFEPLNINGDNAGKKFCQFCINGQNPVAMVFARDASAAGPEARQGTRRRHRQERRRQDG